MMGMRYIVAIIRSDVLKALEGKLASIGVRGLTMTKVKGFGEYADAFSSDWLTVHTKIEIFTDESKAEAITKVIMDVAHSDIPGAGIVAVMPVEKFLHIRTRSETLPDDA